MHSLFSALAVIGAVTLLPSHALAQSGGGGDILGLVLPLGALFLIMYFLIIRPQQKRARTHREMVASLKRGDQVVTNGGLVGKIHKLLDDNECVLEIADNIHVRILKGAVSGLRSQPQQQHTPPPPPPPSSLNNTTPPTKTASSKTPNHAPFPAMEDRRHPRGARPRRTLRFP